MEPDRISRQVPLATVCVAVLIAALAVADRAQPSPPANRVTWERVLPTGSGCWVDRPEPCGPNRWPIAHEPVVGPGNRLWMIGQGKGTGWVWISGDGVNWQREASDAGWGERYGMTSTYFRGRLWMMGGTHITNDVFRNDVWSSGDGRHWVRATASAPWSPRRWHGAIVFQDQLWVIGGSDGRDRNDVWSTVDGQTWIERPEAPWPGRGGHAVMVHAGRLWLVGGGGWDRPFRDVWSTVDGVEWRQETDSAPWPGRIHFGAKAMEGHLWIFGGATRNDVWYSTDGVQWEQAPQPPWGPRTTTTSVVFNRELWVYGGKTGTAETVADEVWRMRPTM